MGKERLAFIRKLIRERGNPNPYTVSTPVIGDNCVIQNGVIIGGDGFGYEMDDDGKWLHFPHYGGVIIGNDVDIYAGTTIQRGTTEDTIIGNNTKIAGHCQIGHNSFIGSNCLLGAYTLVCGSAELGDNVMTGEFVRIAPHVKIGNNVKISSYTNVTKDIPNNSHVRGIPGELI